MDDILYPEWRDGSGMIRFPFADYVTLTNGTDVISETIFLDARLYPIGGIAGQWLSKITVSTEDVVLTVGDTTGDLATATVDKDSIPEEIPLEDTYGRPAGVFIVDTVAFTEFAGWQNGVHRFDRGDTEFTATVVVPVPDIGVRGFLVNDELFAGDVYFVGEQGVVLSDDGGEIRIDIIGDPYFIRELCREEGLVFTPNPLLRTINYIGPDEFGDYKILPGSNITTKNALRIEPTTRGVKIKVLRGGSY